MQARAAKAICVGNIKGGVGKSTLTIYLADFLRHRFKRRNIMMLDTDPQATAFEHRSAAEELSLCRRYCYVITGDGTQGGNGSGEVAISENATLYQATNLFCSVPFKVSMRAKPSLSVTTGTNYYIAYSNNGGTNLDGSQISMNGNTGTENIVLTNNGSSIGTSGHSAIFRTNNTSSKLTISAEL